MTWTTHNITNTNHVAPQRIAHQCRPKFTDSKTIDSTLHCRYVVHLATDFSIHFCHSLYISCAAQNIAIKYILGQVAAVAHQNCCALIVRFCFQFQSTQSQENNYRQHRDMVFSSSLGDAVRTSMDKFDVLQPCWLYIKLCCYYFQWERFPPHSPSWFDFDELARKEYGFKQLLGTQWEIRIHSTSAK